MDKGETNDHAVVVSIKAIHYAWDSEQWLPRVITVCHECQDQAYPCRTTRLIEANA